MIKRRLAFYFVVVSLAASLFMSYTIYYKSNKIFGKNINNLVSSNLNALEKDMAKNLDSVYSIALQICLDSEIQALIANLNYERASLDVKSEYLEDGTVIETLQPKKSEIINELSILNRVLNRHTFAYAINATVTPKLYMYNRPEYLSYYAYPNVTSQFEAENQDWYLQVPAHEPFTLVGINVNKYSQKTIKIVKRLYAYDTETLAYSGLLTIDIDAGFLCTQLDNFKLTENTRIYVINDGGQVQLSNNQAALNTRLPFYEDFLRLKSENPGKSSFLYTQNKSDSNLSYQTINGYGWTIITLSPYDELRASTKDFNTTFFISLMITIALAILFATLLATNIAKPIRELVASMQKVSGGDLTIKMEYKRKDEFAYLIDQYNYMIARVNTLLHDLTESEIQKKEWEIQALQSQITPHFLYNTLDSINLLAIQTGNSRISEVVVLLANFYRYTLNKGKLVITLADEKKQVETYLALQKIRMGNRFQSHLHIGKECRDVVTVKLILQPLVENALLHGIQPLPLEKEGIIRIDARLLGNDVIIIVEDNGIGGDMEELNDILEHSNSAQKAYGIRNVHRRLRDYFGEPYGLHYENSELGGVKAIITIPSRINKE